MNKHLKTPKRCGAPYIVTNTQEERVRVRMLPLTVAGKNGNDFQIIFAHHIFLSSNTGIIQAPQISSPQVSVTAYFNVSLKCLAFVRPSDCWDNSLRWYFNNRSGELKSGEKYDIQESKTNTRCKTDFILTIINVTEADEGKYKCQWLCDEDFLSFSRSSIIQLIVFPPPPEEEEGQVLHVRSCIKRMTGKWFFLRCCLRPEYYNLGYESGACRSSWRKMGLCFRCHSRGHRRLRHSNPRKKPQERRH
ncbi:unnamed protein product [Porites evermanni]|uniref:Ig-like domain-containing protein n=1 Tax=Porites evermanni TaxID=104178 RepID=A0ABN8RUQ6_9CNID|nr:unnamed protein product [Porites evermanni]